MEFNVGRFGKPLKHQGFYKQHTSPLNYKLLKLVINTSIETNQTDVKIKMIVVENYGSMFDEKNQIIYISRNSDFHIILLISWKSEKTVRVVR